MKPISRNPKKKKIIVYGINYAPELTGIGKYTGEMCSWLAARNFDVRVITAMPYYPEWKKNKKYKWRWWHTEKTENVSIHRCPLYVPRKVTSFRRLVHEFSFMTSIFPFFLKTLFQKKADALICISPPFHIGIYGYLYSRLKRVKMITHIQDLQVDAAKELGLIKNKFLLGLLFRLEKFLLRKSNALSTISTGMAAKILLKRPGKNVVLFPNWVDENYIRPIPKEESLRKEFGIDLNDTVIMYSGNIGEKQGLEHILDVANELKQRTNIFFLIVGSGGASSRLKELTHEMGLSNVKFFPLQPYEKLAALLATADIHLVLEKKSAADLVMPSKLTGILSAGGCAIVTASSGSNLYQLIDEYNMGILVEPENPKALKNAIEYAIHLDLSAYKTRARQYALQFLSKEIIMRKWEKFLLSL